jgi:hypothetical protein
MGALWTYKGRLVDPSTLTPDQIDPHSIIHSLALLNRYGGHTMRPYSVAEHSVHLSRAVPVHLRRAVLVHDWSEPIFGVDIPRPLKRTIPGYEEAEQGVQKMIFAKFNIPWAHMEELAEYDTRICQDEMEQGFLYPYDCKREPLGIVIEFWDWLRAKNELTNACHAAGLI